MFVVRLNERREMVPEGCLRAVAGLRAVSRLEEEGYHSIVFRNDLEEARRKVSEAMEVLRDVCLDLPAYACKNIMDRLRELSRFLEEQRSARELKESPIEAGTYNWIRGDFGQALKEAWDILMFKCLK